MRAATLEIPVGTLVAERPGRAEVLDRFGIDYCCGGKLPIRWFCEKRGLDPAEVMAALADWERTPPIAPTDDWLKAPLAELIVHLVGVHHHPTRAAMTRLDAMIVALSAAHGARFPALGELARCFPAFRQDLLAHMDHEEQVIFPLIIKLERGLADQALGKRFLTQELGRMEAEHREAGDDLARMSRLTAGFVAPPGACEHHVAMLAALSALVADTHRHVHKENSILFPRAARLVANVPAIAGASRCGKRANRGEIVFPEKHPADPTKDAETGAISHRGGLASARAELY